MKLFRILILIQGLYTLLTALWPILDIESFMAVTGPKTDVWLVKTVGALLIPQSLGLLTFLFIKSNRTPALVLGSLSCIVFIMIDFYYALRDVISDIYMADACCRSFFLIGWIYIAIRGEVPLRSSD